MAHQDFKNHLAIIVNPVSGKHNTLSWSKSLVQKLEDHNISFRLFTTIKRGHARNIALQLSDEGWKIIISVGGDGTNTETVQGIMQSKNDPIYGHIPKGSGNDWATYHQLSTDLDQIVNAILHPVIKMTDICKVTSGTDTTHFCNILGCGFDTQVVSYINEKIKRKRPWTYKLAIIKNIFRYDPREFHLTLDGECISSNLYSGHFGIGRQSGGGQIILPHAGNNIPGIAYTLVHPTSIFKLLMATKSLNTGQITQLPFVKTGHAHEIQIVAKGKYAFEADGEILPFESIKNQP